MAFRKRTTGISHTSGLADTVLTTSNVNPLGVRPSPVDGRPTTSTGTPSLDSLLAGHAGLALGTSLLIEETGTSDYAGALLRYYAAEGIVQGHKIHVVGMREQWGRELPRVVGRVGEENSGNDGGRTKKEAEKMKIAWRYDGMGEFGTGTGNRAAVERNPSTLFDSIANVESVSFCHVFDLAKRLEWPTKNAINYIPIDTRPNSSPFAATLQSLTTHLSSPSGDSIHRLVLPTILSPALYQSNASSPHHVLGFLHSLRSLLRQYPLQLTAMMTVPIELFPRSTGLVRWMELLSDGVLELMPFPHLSVAAPPTSSSRAGTATEQEDQPQGMAKIHKFPIFHEKGGGGGGLKGLGDDLAFVVSRRKFVIKPFSLPPADGDTEAQQGAESEQNLKKASIDF